MKKLCTWLVLASFFVLAGCKGPGADIERKIKMLEKKPDRIYCHGARGIHMVEVTNAEAVEYIKAVGHFPACSDYIRWREKQDSLPAR